MGIGLEITNDYGRKQVIDTAPILTLSDKKIVDNTAFKISDELYVSTARVTALAPSEGQAMTIVNSDSARGGIDPYTGARMQYFVRGKGEVFIFQETQPITSSSFGLEVYNERGEIQFSSNQKPLRILDFIDIADIRQHGDTLGSIRRYWNKSYPGKKIATIVSRYPIWYNNGYYITAAMFKRGSAYSVEAYAEQIAGLGGSGLIEAWNYQALVVDATNY